MNVFSARGRALLCFVFAAALAAGSARPAFAQATTFVSGHVTSNGAPLAGADVELRGNNLDLHRTTGADGSYSFTAGVGHYTLSAKQDVLAAEQQIDLTGSGVIADLAVRPLSVIGTVTVKSRSPATQSSGTDVILNAATLAHLPAAGSIPDILVQLPNAARGSNGQIHLNGDHNGVNYVLDGVRYPESLARVLGSELDPSTIGYLDAVQGAYPAEYGDAFGTVLDIASKAYSGAAGLNGTLRAGSYNLSEGILDAHVPVGQGGSLVFSTRFSRDGRILDPATPDAPHNEGSTVSQFLRLSLPLSTVDFLNLDVIHSEQTFQIPPDLSSGVPATTDDNEYASDTFLSLQFRHAIGQSGALSFGPTYKVSRLLDTNDLPNDLAPAVGTTCTDFSNCPYFSVFADRYAHDYGFTANYAGRSSRHDVRIGGSVDAIAIPKLYQITVQAGNQLSPAGAAFPVTDNHTNQAFQQALYAQDGWTMARDWRLDYGLRYDAFSVGSDTFSSYFNQVSPRIKLTHFFGERASVYAYYGRLFEPFSFETIDPTVAAQLYVPGSFPGTTFDLLPERDSLYEIGAHLPVGKADLGLRVSRRVATDWIDDTQVGATNLHQDINFPRGLVNSQSLYLQRTLAGGARSYLSVSHVIALNSANCETQLLQNCALNGPPGGDLVQADHDQHWDTTAGIVIPQRRGGWLSLTGEYGSGLSHGLPDGGNPCALVNCTNYKVPPHLTFDVAKGFTAGPGTLVLSIQNLLNDRYAITLDNTLQGTHYAQPRAINVEYRMQGRTASKEPGT